jgi:hypothetical protein
MRNFFSAPALALMALISSAALADTLHFHTQLSGNREKIPNSTTASGEATVELNTDTKVASYRIEFTGLSSPTTKVHFHGLKLSGMKAPEVIVMHVRAPAR